MASLTEITSEESFKSTLSSTSASTLAVLYFHTPWAAPCTQMRTILTALASTYTSPSSAPAFLSVNAEDLPDISESYDVTAVPFLVLLRDGKTLETVSGSDPTKVRAAVERHGGDSRQQRQGGHPTTIDCYTTRKYQWHDFHRHERSLFVRTHFIRSSNCACILFRIHGPVEGRTTQSPFKSRQGGTSHVIHERHAICTTVWLFTPASITIERKRSEIRDSSTSWQTMK